MSTDFPARTLRIGTRSSPMALAQVEQVSALLRKQEPRLAVDVVPVTTEADLWPGDLAQVGGKGLFVKQIDRMLQHGEVDMAVHCLKDVPGDVPVPDGLVLAAFLQRDDVRDALLLPAGSPLRTLDDLPAGARLGTSAVRRKAQVARMRPDLEVVHVRGTVGTRVEKLDGARPTDVPLDAMILAVAGLERLGLSDRARQVFGVDAMLPAIGAGALALACRQDDAPVAALLAALNHERTMTEVTAEREMLRGLNGHCNSPIAGYCATGPDGRLGLHGMVFTPDGTRLTRTHLRAGPGEPPEALGARAATDLLSQGAAAIIAEIPH